MGVRMLPVGAVAAPAVAATLVLLILLGSACSPRGIDSGQTRSIEASDGEVRAVLTLPDDALPDDVSADDIRLSISMGESTQVVGGPGDEATLTLLTLELRPSGIVFREPVPLEVTLPTSAGGAITALLRSGDNAAELLRIDFPPSVEAELREGEVQPRVEGEPPTVQLMVPHFSELWVLVHDMSWPTSIVQGPPERDIAVGEQFTVQVSMERPALIIDSLIDGPLFSAMGGNDGPMGDLSDITAEGGRFLLRADRGRDWHLGWTWWGESRLPLSLDANGAWATAVSPYRVMSEGEFDGNEGATVEQTYTCHRPGEFKILFTDLRLRVPVTVEAVGESETFEETLIVTLRGDFQQMSGRCVEAPVNETATATGTPTDVGATPTPSAGDGRRVLMVVMDGMYYPAPQFDLLASGAPEPGHSCTRPHYHAKDGGELAVGLVALDSMELDFFGDPDSSGCGYGLYDDFERVNVELTLDQVEALLGWLSASLMWGPR